MMFCREYLIFSPSPPPNRLVKVNKIFSLSRHSVPQHQTGNKSPSLQSNYHQSKSEHFSYDISISVRFLMIFSNNHSVISNKLFPENRCITLPETKINYKSVRSDTSLSSPSSGSSSSSSWSDHWVSRTRLLAASLTNCEKKARTELALGSQH